MKIVSQPISPVGISFSQIENRIQSLELEIAEWRTHCNRLLIQRNSCLQETRGNVKQLCDKICQESTLPEMERIFRLFISAMPHFISKRMESRENEMVALHVLQSMVDYLHYYRTYLVSVLSLNTAFNFQSLLMRVEGLSQYAGKIQELFRQELIKIIKAELTTSQDISCLLDQITARYQQPRPHSPIILIPQPIHVREIKPSEFLLSHNSQRLQLNPGKSSSNEEKDTDNGFSKK